MGWPAVKAKQLLAALLRAGWVVARQKGSHRTLSKPGCGAIVFAFHDGEEVRPRLVAKIARQAGLSREEL